MNSGVRVAAPMDQPTFTGFSSDSQAWQSYDRRPPPTPVPEPATYGALLVAFVFVFALWRRARSRGKTG